MCYGVDDIVGCVDILYGVGFIDDFDVFDECVVKGVFVV